MADIKTRSDGVRPRKQKPTRATRLGPYDEGTARTYLEELEATGLKYHSARAAGSCYRSMQARVKEDEEFAELEREALARYKESLLEAAHQRAVHGVDEPVFSQRTGSQIGVVRKYSDSLLQTLLKAKIPEEFRENISVDANVRGSGVLLTPGVVSSAEEWEQVWGEAAKGKGGSKNGD